jgi:hypothetical protein
VGLTCGPARVAPYVRMLAPDIHVRRDWGKHPITCRQGGASHHNAPPADRRIALAHSTRRVRKRPTRPRE